ncbi:phage tail protein [Nocardia sp. NPDC058518]|uniref:phage tail protein n=1 Tax=Nocardia sp. NPDC058518 TaxID=3346534 RepID=UPI003655C88F
MTNAAVPAPVPTYRYRCTIGDESVAFNSVSGLELSVDAIEYKDGFGNWFQKPGERSELNITLRRGAPGSVSGVWKQWAEGVGNNDVDKRDLSIAFTTEDGSGWVVAWHVCDAVPTKVSVDDLDGDGTYEFEELSLLASRMTVAFS